MLSQPRAALLVSSRFANSVLCYDATTGAFIDAFVAPNSGGLENPSSLAFGPDNNFYVASFKTNSVLRYDGQTGAFIDAFVPPSSGGLDGSISLTFRPDNYLCVVSGKFGSNSILRYNATSGEFIDTFVPSGSGGLEAPVGMAFEPDNNLYVASLTQGNIRCYNGQTGEFIDTFVPSSNDGLVDGATGFSDPLGFKGFTGLTFGSDNISVPYKDSYTTAPATIDTIPHSRTGDVFDSNGNCYNLYVASFKTNSVLRYDGQTGKFIDSFFPSGSGGLEDPTGITFGPDNNLYVNSHRNNRILRDDGQTGAFIDVFVPPGSGGLSGPNIGLIFSPTAFDGLALG